MKWSNYRGKKRTCVTNDQLSRPTKTAAARLKVLRLGASRFIASTDAPPIEIMPTPAMKLQLKIAYVRLITCPSLQVGLTTRTYEIALTIRIQEHIYTSKDMYCKRGLVFGKKSLRGRELISATCAGIL